MWWSLAFGCDPSGLQTLSAEPLDTVRVAAGIVRACPQPTVLKRALQHLDDPWHEVNIASHASLWNEVCGGRLDALPSGFSKPTQGERAALAQSCGVDPELVSTVEFVRGSGPPLIGLTVAAVFRKHRIPLDVARPLVRALLAVPELSDPPVVGTLPTVVHQEPVPWPPNVRDAHCTVDAEILDNGSLGELYWVDCEERWKGYVRVALVASIFEPGTLADRKVGRLLRLKL